MPKRKKIMRSFKIDEISAVDNPCQVGAKVVLTKRAPDEPYTDDVQSFAKVSFKQALEETTMERKFADAFYESFDGLWTVNDAFREALKDAYQDSEETLRQYIEEVTRIARAALEKTKSLTKGAEIDSNAIQQAMAKAGAELVETRKEQQMPKITNKAELTAAIAKFEKDGGTNADIAAIAKAASDLGHEDLLPDTGALAKSKDADEIAKLQARLDKRDKVDALDTDTRKYYDGLAEDAQDDFLAKSADDQAAEIAAKNSDDPVVHKCFDGTEIRKSDGPTVLALAKGRDADQAEIKKLRESNADSDIEKRAATEFPNVAKDTAVSMLKSANAVGADTDAGKTVITTLTNMNKNGGKLFEEIGEGGGDPLNKNDTSAVVAFDKKVAEIAKRDSIDTAAAMSKARVEAPDEFAAAYPDAAERDQQAA